MPRSDSMHPSKRPDAGQTKGDTVPPPQAPEGSLYVVTSYIWDDQYWLEGLRPPEVYVSAQAANVAARRMMNRHAEMLNELGDNDEFDFQHNEDQECGEVGLYNGKLVWKDAHTAAEIRVFRVNGPEGVFVAEKVKGDRKNGKGGSVKVELFEEDDNSGDDDEIEGGNDTKDEDNPGDEEEKKPASSNRPRKVPSRFKAPATSSSASATSFGKAKGKIAAPAKTAVQTSTYRKKIPEGKPNCLRGLKILFTGTFETMDRKTSIATAVRYGADVITKLEDTDYIVVGLRAGPKKLQEINEKELETINEEEFFQILENGVSREKRERMAARRRADEEAREEEEGEGKGSDADNAAKGTRRWKRAKR